MSRKIILCFCLSIGLLSALILLALPNQSKIFGSPALRLFSWTTEDTKPLGGRATGTEDIPPAGQSATCKRVNNVAFIKTYKAGSSTIASILQRYGIEHDLNFALPNRKYHSKHYMVIVEPGEVFTPDRLIPLPPGQSYNILWSHSVYNRTAFRSVMPKDTVYITIVREPSEQFLSAFNYYGVVRRFSRIVPSFAKDPNPVSVFLKSPGLQFQLKYRFPYADVQNRQSQAVGFGEDEYVNEVNRKAYIDVIEHDFTWVMITEHMDESLLILKRKLCWDMKDILYLSKNKFENKLYKTFTKEDHDNHREYSASDYALYRHFLDIYKKTLQQEDFSQELAHFKTLLSKVRHNCDKPRAFSVPGSEWHKSFTVTLNDCKLLNMTVLEGLDLLLDRMHVRIE